MEFYLDGIARKKGMQAVTRSKRPRTAKTAVYQILQMPNTARWAEGEEGPRIGAEGRNGVRSPASANCNPPRGLGKSDPIIWGSSIEGSGDGASGSPSRSRQHDAGSVSPCSQSGQHFPSSTTLQENKVKSNKQSRTGTAAAGSISPRQVRSNMASTCLTGTISTRMRGSGQGIIPDPWFGAWVRRATKRKSQLPIQLDFRPLQSHPINPQMRRRSRSRG